MFRTLDFKITIKQKAKCTRKFHPAAIFFVYISQSFTATKSIISQDIRILG
jgi:hypothetical protein